MSLSVIKLVTSDEAGAKAAGEQALERKRGNTKEAQRKGSGGTDKVRTMANVSSMMPHLLIYTCGRANVIGAGLTQFEADVSLLCRTFDVSMAPSF